MRSFRKFALVGVSLISLSAPAFAAQPAPEANETTAASEDQPIIVEARRRDENQQDVPLVVNVVTAATLDKLNLRSATDITAVVPGLSLTVNANGIGSSSSMRGINHDVNVSGENGTIQYYFADAPVPSNFALQSLYDIGQIEVLRGPQGTLRGRSTPSGSITFGAKKANLNEVGGFVQGTYASGETSNVNFGIGVPIIADKLAVRVAGLYTTGQGDRVTSVNNPTVPSSTTQSIRASARFEPVEFIKLGFLFQSLESNSVGFDQVQSFNQVVTGYTPPAPLLSTNPGTALVLGGAPASQAGNYGTISLKDRKSVEFTPRTTYQQFKFYAWDAQLDFAGQSLYYVGSHEVTKFNPITNSDAGAIFPALTLQQNTSTTSSQDSHEIRLQNKDRIAGIFDYVVGYFRQVGRPETFLTSASTLAGYFPITIPTGAPPPAPATIPALTKVTDFFATNTPIYLPKGRTFEESFFGNVTLHLGEGTEIAGGLRRIKFTSAPAGLFINCTVAQQTAGTCVVSPGTNLSYDVSKTIYNATVRHRFSDSFMVYAATGSSFRPPVRAIGDFSSSYSPLEIAHISFGPESSKSYEVGFKSDWLDKKLLLNVTAYHQEFQNYPFRAAGAGVYFINIDAAGQPGRSQFNFISAVPVKVDGVEAELAYNPSRNFSLSGNLSYSKSKIGNALIACTDALNNVTGATGKDGIPDTVAPTLAQLQGAYGTEHLAECPASGSATFNPEWSGSVQAEYSLPLTDGADAYLRGLLSYRGATKNDPANAYDDVGAYGLINLYAGVRDPKGAWELNFFVKNISNVTRLLSGSDNTFGASTTLLNVSTFRPFGSAQYQSFYRSVTVTPPREFGVNLRMAIGSR